MPSLSWQFKKTFIKVYNLRQKFLKKIVWGRIYLKGIFFLEESLKVPHKVVATTNGQKMHKLRSIYLLFLSLYINDIMHWMNTSYYEYSKVKIKMSITQILTYFWIWNFLDWFAGL